MIGLNNPWSAITATIVKNTTKSAVNGSDSVNASPKWCSKGQAFHSTTRP